MCDFDLCVFRPCPCASSQASSPPSLSFARRRSFLARALKRSLRCTQSPMDTRASGRVRTRCTLLATHARPCSDLHHTCSTLGRDEVSYVLEVWAGLHCHTLAGRAGHRHRQGSDEQDTKSEPKAQALDVVAVLRRVWCTSDVLDVGGNTNIHSHNTRSTPYCQSGDKSVMPRNASEPTYVWVLQYNCGPHATVITPSL